MLVILRASAQGAVVELEPELGAVVGLDHLHLEAQLLEHAVQETGSPWTG